MARAGGAAGDEDDAERGRENHWVPPLSASGREDLLVEGTLYSHSWICFC